MRLSAFSLLLALPAMGWAAPDTSKCEASNEVRQALKRTDVQVTNPEKRREVLRPIFAELLEKYPNDLFIHLAYQTMLRGSTVSERQTIIAQYGELLAKHAVDPMYRFLSAKSWIDTDTPRALEQLKNLPDYPYSHLSLADIYAYGKWADRSQLRKEVDAYMAACPGSLSQTALTHLARSATAEQAAKYAPAMRERLIQETDADRLKSWTGVWNLEFKAKPVPEHVALRKQIAEDLKRIQDVAKAADVGWLAFLKNGYTLADDKTEVEKLENRMLADFGNSLEARRVLRERFSKAFPFPKPDDSDEKRNEFYNAQLKLADDLLKRTPNEFEPLMLRFNSLAAMEGAEPAQIRAAGDAMLDALRKKPGWSSMPPFEFQIARAFVKKGVAPERVTALIEEGWATYAEEQRRANSDRDPDEYRTMDAESGFSMKTQAASILIDAARELKKPEIAKASMAAIQDAKPEKPYARIGLWNAKAKYAELEGRKLDALLMYRASIEERPSDFRKPKKDEIADSYDRLWKELGGTDLARALWEAKAKTVEVAKEGRWEKPKKALPPWSLTDLQGKTWKMTQLEGKLVLINLWATWCGPCRDEHPHLQKLYERVKDRPDIQIVTFNVDDEVGKVQPYMKEMGFTFPVVLAKSFVDDLIPMLSIPRNWLVNAKGQWQWEQIGFGADPQWEQSMIDKLEKMKTE